MAFSPITNVRLSDKVVQAIMDQINDGTLQPGDKLPNENDLSEALGVSRGILREALTILQARNYIFRKPKEGTFVNPEIREILNSQMGISLKQATYLDMLEMRECIEQRAAEKIIDLAKDSQIEELYSFIRDGEQQRENGSVDYYFHYRLAELSQNVMFVNFIDTYYDVIDELAKKTRSVGSRRSEIDREHKAIIDALYARDKEWAKQAVVSHLQKVKENIVSYHD